MQPYKPLPTHATPPPRPGETRYRECKACGAKKPLTDEFYRPRRKGEAVWSASCRACEANHRRDERELQATTDEENKLASPNERIVKEYVPERVDLVEVAAMKAAMDLGVEFRSDEAWAEFCESVLLQAEWRFLSEPEEFERLARELLQDRN